MSPPAWGWPGRVSCTCCPEPDVPTRVGMARCAVPPSMSRNRCPHPRGDGPPSSGPRQSLLWMSPPAWGWPAKLDTIIANFGDVPTRVGMARFMLIPEIPTSGCPHPRGDGPLLSEHFDAGFAMSPPAWGWPAKKRLTPARLSDVPTRVGMARAKSTETASCARCPHPRGDGPFSMPLRDRASQMSPPAWGWPVMTVAAIPANFDVPTRVGMARV